MIDVTQALPTILSVLGSVLLTGVGWILKTLAGQNRAMASQTQALAVLVTRVDPAIENIGKTQALEVTVGKLDTRVLALEQARSAPLQTVTVN